MTPTPNDLPADFMMVLAVVGAFLLLWLRLGAVAIPKDEYNEFKKNTVTLKNCVQCGKMTDIRFAYGGERFTEMKKDHNKTRGEITKIKEDV